MIEIAIFMLVRGWMMILTSGSVESVFLLGSSNKSVFFTGEKLSRPLMLDRNKHDP